MGETREMDLTPLVAIEQTLRDARLGAALRAALADAERERFVLSVWRGTYDWHVQLLDGTEHDNPTDATKALAAALPQAGTARPAEQEKETA